MRESDGVWKREDGGDGKNINQWRLKEPKNGKKTPSFSVGNGLLLKKVFCGLCRQSRTFIDSLSANGKRKTGVSF